MPPSPLPIGHRRSVFRGDVFRFSECEQTVTEHPESADVWIVYILRCKDGTFYTGITKDITRRCRQHNAGIASRYTRSRLPVEVVYQELLRGRGVALKRELALKAMSRKNKEEMIRGEGKNSSD